MDKCPGMAQWSGVMRQLCMIRFLSCLFLLWKAVYTFIVVVVKKYMYPKSFFYAKVWGKKTERELKIQTGTAEDPTPFTYVALTAPDCDILWHHSVFSNSKCCEIVFIPFALPCCGFNSKYRQKIQGGMCFCLERHESSHFCVGFFLPPKSRDLFSEQITAHHTASSWEVFLGEKRATCGVLDKQATWVQSDAWLYEPCEAVFHVSPDARVTRHWNKTKILTINNITFCFLSLYNKTKQPYG